MPARPILSICKTVSLANKKTHPPERFVGATEHSFSPTVRPYNRTRGSLRSTEVRLEGTRVRGRSRKNSVPSTQVSLVSPEVRGDIPALRGNLPETSGEGTEVVLDRKKVSLRSTELRLERTEDQWTATQRRIEGTEIARVSPGVFWHPAHAALFSTGGVSDRTHLRGVATKRLRAPTSFLVERQLHLKISFLNNTNAKRRFEAGCFRSQTTNQRPFSIGRMKKQRFKERWKSYLPTDC